MALIHPGPSWAHYSDNMPSTPSTSLFGTAVTAGASNADGSAVTGLSALAHDVEHLIVTASGFNAAGGSNSSALLDVLIDPAGGTSWAPLIDDLLVGHSVVIALGTSNMVGLPIVYRFPIWIPAGASIGLQARAANGAGFTGRVILMAHGGAANPGQWRCGQKVTSVGIDAANSKGTDHTPGNAGSFSSWANLGSTIPMDAIAAQVATQGDDSGSSNNLAYTMELGAGSSRIIPPLYFGTGSSETCASFPREIGWCGVPAGTQLQVRAKCSATAQTVDAAAYLVH